MVFESSEYSIKAWNLIIIYRRLRMKTLTVEKAQKQFDKVILNIQNESIQIEDAGKPIAVIMSVEQFKINQMIEREMVTSKEGLK